MPMCTMLHYALCMRTSRYHETGQRSDMNTNDHKRDRQMVKATRFNGSNG